jgi:hypothetical protein
MDTRRFLKLLAILWIVFTSSFYYTGQVFAQTNQDSPTNSKQSETGKVLKATVEIKMDVSTGSNGDQVEAKGLGSLVSDGDKTLLVTHNHWGEVLQKMTVIEFYNTAGQLLKMMFGSEFKSLVAYQDAGTLVLNAPEDLVKLNHRSKKALLGTAELGDSHRVKAGDIVTLIYHLQENQKGIGVLEARVESIFQFLGLPAFKLRSLDGTPIMKGDSGGGIWSNGQLVGNMWATVQKEGSTSQSAASNAPANNEFQPTDISYGAILPF